MTSMPGSNPNHGNLDNSDNNLPPPPAAFSPSSSHSQFLTVNIPCTRLVHHADNRSSPSPSKPAHKPLPSQSVPSHDPPPLVASGSSSSAPLSRPPAASATTATQRDYARRTSHIDDSLSSIVCYPYSTSSSIDSHRATGQFGRRSDAVHYMLYLKRKDEGPCPEDPTQELVQNVLSEYDRLGSDSVNQYVRETVLGKWKDEKSNFTVLDVGCGIGGTMYSLAAKGHLNPHVASFKAEKANPKAWAKAWRGASTKSQGNLHYVGVALSSAEVVMAKKEASKRNLNPPFVDFVQQSFDDPELPVSGADAVVAIDSFGYSSNLDKTLKNVASKMKSGTTVVVVDYIRTKPYHDHNVYLAEGKWSFQRYLQSAYNPNNVNKKRQVKRKNFMSIHHPNFDRSQCLREAEGHDRARHFYTLDAWLSAFRSADLWVSDMSDIGTEHGGSSSPPLQGGDKAELRLGAFGFFGSSRQTMVIFWTLFTRFKNMLGYVFGMRPYIRDELEVYLGKVGWLIHSNLKDPDFPEEHTDEEVWTGRDAAMRFATVRLNQLLVDGYHLHLYRELEECAFENGDIALYGFVLTKK